MGRVMLRRDLDVMVAATMIRPKVERIVEDLRDEARRLAPDAKVWVTAEDERVRYSHEHVHGETIPENLRYRLPSVAYVRRVGYVPVEGRADLAREPRDPALPVEQRINCRCVSVGLPGVVAASIHAGSVTVSGRRVTGEVYTRFPRAEESEFGTSEDEPAVFMRGALAVAVASLLASRRR
jgi:hypothetical protein